jgi:hypothetical protein
MFRPQVFSTSRRFAPPPALQAYFIPQPRPGFLRSGVSSVPQPRRLVADDVPPCRYHPPAHRCCHRLPRSNGPTSRLCSTDRHIPRGWC